MQAEFLRLWVEEMLGMTCNVPQEFSSNFVKCREKHAAGTYLGETKNEENDGYMCLVMDMQTQGSGRDGLSRRLELPQRPCWHDTLPV